MKILSPANALAALIIFTTAIGANSFFAAQDIEGGTGVLISRRPENPSSGAAAPHPQSSEADAHAAAQSRRRRASKRQRKRERGAKR
ncbi:MAG: hypothetical protein WKF30_09285 [Pyrinomonadaceae bacterium]